MASAQAKSATADTMADIVEAHAEQVNRKVAAQHKTRQAFIGELLNEGTDEVVPDHAQERVPHIVLVVRAL